MITREQVADLQPGDVIRVAGWDQSAPLTVEGPLRVTDVGARWMGTFLWLGGPEVGDWPHWFVFREAALTVVSRAPRPLYVNHPRTEPVPGDVVRDADSDDAKVWFHGRTYEEDPCWLDAWRMVNPITNKMPARLHLLVDGETGQVVP